MKNYFCWISVDHLIYSAHDSPYIPRALWDITILSLYFYNLNVFPWDLFSFAFFFSYTFPGVLWGEQSLTIAGSSLNLAESCPFQFTHLQNGNNNKHLRENIRMSSLRPLMFGSPEAQQREIASNSDDLNGFLMEPDSAAGRSSFQLKHPYIKARHWASSFLPHPEIISKLSVPPWSNIWLTQWFSNMQRGAGCRMKITHTRGDQWGRMN